MKKLLLLAPVLLFAACAPAQGVPPTTYVAVSSDILASVSQACPQLKPVFGFNYLSVTSVTPTSVTCTAEQTTAMQIVSALGSGRKEYVSITFTALQNGNITSVAGSGLSEGRKLVEQMFQILDGKFQRVK
jgi:hypothetical protein